MDGWREIPFLTFSEITPGYLNGIPGLKIMDPALFACQKKPIYVFGDLKDIAIRCHLKRETISTRSWTGDTFKHERIETIVIDGRNFYLDCNAWFWFGGDDAS